MLDATLLRLVKPVYDELKKIGKITVDWGKYQGEVLLARNRYAETYLHRHGQLKVLGMSKPRPLDSVYIAVRLLDHEGIRSFKSIENLEEAYRNQGKRGFRQNKDQACPGLKVANETQYLMVLGGPGTGKSTFLRKMGLEVLKGYQHDKYVHECLPVLIELKQFRYKEVDIEAAIAHEFEICGFPESKHFTHQILKEGKLLVLLDGLDEVPTEIMSEAIIKIQDFANRYKQNRFITSCRIAAYRHSFRQFTDVAIAEFNDEQIENFIKNWFHGQPNQGRECWQKLQSGDYKAAKELTHTPILLTLICLVYCRAGQFPANRASLYKRAVEALLEEWDAEKEVPREPVYKGLDTMRKGLLLAEIAYTAFAQDRLFLEVEAISTQIEALLKDMPIDDKTLIDGRKVVRSIEVQHGLFVERATDVYSFSHLTIQEFFCAKHILDNSSRNQDLLKMLVTEHLVDDRWREVFLMVAGLKLADDLLMEMEEQAQGYVLPYPKLHSILKWADDVTTGSEGGDKPAVKRAISIYFILALDRARDLDRDRARARTSASALARALDLDLDRALARALDLDRARARALDLARTSTRALDRALALDLDRALALALDLDRARDRAQNLEKKGFFAPKYIAALISALKALGADIPNKEQPPELWQAFSERIENAYYDSLQLSSGLLSLSESEVEALSNYLRANELMIRCKESAVRVSRTTWEEIEGRMLLFHGDASGS